MRTSQSFRCVEEQLIWRVPNYRPLRVINVNVTLSHMNYVLRVFYHKLHDTSVYSIECRPKMRDK